MKKVITIVIVLIVLIIIFFIKINYKKFSFGNNSNKSADNIKKYILGIKSYEAEEEITVKSNKTKNVYRVKTQYIKDNNLNKTEIQEPYNISGTKLIYNGEKLVIENEKINISYFYEKYKYIGENNITLAKFIEDYKNSENVKIENEENNYIIIIDEKNGNKYNKNKKLYINKKSLKPCKLEIQDITQNTRIYILYNEIKINNLQEEDILGFKTIETKEDI